MFGFFRSLLGGLFPGTTTTHVSSSVYNLAGDVKQRPDFLKTITVSHILTGEKRTATRNTLDKYLGGPGINVRRFGRWAKESGYNAAIGTSNSSVTVPSEIDQEVLVPILNDIYGTTVLVSEALIDATDYYKWAMQYMLANLPEKFGEVWTADYDEMFNQMIITIPGMAPIAFTPAGFENFRQYLYVRLNQERMPESSSSFGSWIQGFGPSRSGYSQISTSTVTETVDSTTVAVVTKTKAGEAPRVHEISTPVTVSFELKGSLYTKYSLLPDPASTLVVGHVTDSITTRQRYEVVPKVTETTDTVGDETIHIVRTDQVVKIISEYQVGKVTVRQAAWTGEEIFIYKRGSGNADLDALFTSSTTAGTFFPVIPIRIDNQFVSQSYYGHIHPWVEKAVRRATNFTFDKVVDQISQNPSLGDIDYAYMVFGVSLNTPENTGKRYLYEFFKDAGLAKGEAALDAFWGSHSAAHAAWDAWVLWYQSERNVSTRDRISSAVVVERPAIPAVPQTSIVVSAAVNYTTIVSFAGVSETTHVGKYIPSVKVDDLRIYMGPTQFVYGFEEHIYGRDGSGGGYPAQVIDKLESIFIEWQVGENTFRRLKVTNPIHTNYVYQGRTIVTLASQALGSGAESGFIVPMQDETLRSLSIPVATQLVTSCNYMVFNCYQVVRQEWYETSFFKFILLVVIVVVMVYTGGGSAGASGGLLGSNAMVGATLGFVGTTAIVVGAIANAIVGMIVAQIISRVSVQLFGEKFGTIIGAIASIAVLHIGTNIAAGQGMAASFGSMMNAENLMKLTVATADGLTKYMQSTTQDYMTQSEQTISDYTTRMKEISEKFLKEFGPGDGADIGTVQQAVINRLEKPEVFLSRTLLTGTDIADMSHTMLDNFTEFSVTTPLE